MKGLLDRTKVVIRHLPPSISLATVMEQIDGAFADRYNWSIIRPSKCGRKYQVYSKLYIDFNNPDDVVEFAEFFDGHIFVNEKGTQFKAVVEYAPSQRVPKHCPKKDNREGTLLKDPEYLEFLEFIAKPAENLPSAEIQMDRREAEKAGTAKDVPIITPLMEFIRQKRAIKSASRGYLSNGKLSRRATKASGGSSSSLKRGSGKKGNSTTMYVLRDTAKVSSGKEKSVYIDPKHDDKKVLDDKATFVTSASRTESLELENGSPSVSAVSGISVTSKKKILLLKGKDRDSHVMVSDLQNVASPVKSPFNSSVPKQTPRREGSTRIIKSILVNKDVRHNQSSSGIQSEESIELNVENNRRPPRSPNTQVLAKERSSEDKMIRSHRQERRAKNKDRPDRGVWAPLRRSDGPYASDESLSSASQVSLDFPEGCSGDSSMDNGTVKHVVRRVLMKDVDGCSKKGAHEKQVWVQKSSSGS